MTAIADSGRKAGWRGRLVWLALALSLTLNVCFLGGLAWMHMHAPPPPLMRMRALGQSLQLNDTQRQAFEQFLRTIRLRGRFVRETNETLVENLWSEEAKPAPDDAAVAKLGDQINGNRETLQREVSTAFDTFLKTLTPEQRARLAAKAKTPPDPVTHRIFQMIVP